MMDLYRVAIAGSYGNYNLGDEAILRVIIAELRKAGPMHVTVLSRDAEETRRRQAVDHAVAFGSLSRSETEELFRGLDLFILGGGGILYDEDLEMYARETLIAQELGVPVMVYAISAGPLERMPSRVKAAQLLNKAAAITVRDQNSRRLLEEVGVKRPIEVTADPAVLLEPEPLSMKDILKAEAIDPNATLIGLSVRELGPAAPGVDIEHYHRLVANAADYLVDRYGAEVVFFPLERRSFDVQHSHGVIARMSRAQHATVLKGEYSPGQIVSLLRHFQFAAGMRLHFLIFSALAEVPFVALPYAAKVTGFLEDLKLDAPALEQVSAGQFIASVDRAWNKREELRAQVRGGLEGLRARARRNIAVAAALLTGP
ncbi:MAG: polysaccharide pyruvyl transferase family protein [Elusimicrobiota bacterium]|nr:polysaccharide pyruvyl transferase family protein [Elusimicrobiota bacterium]